MKTKFKKQLLFIKVILTCLLLNIVATISQLGSINTVIGDQIVTHSLKV